VFVLGIVMMLVLGVWPAGLLANLVTLSIVVGCALGLLHMSCRRR
jgi:hypothetical protein